MDTLNILVIDAHPAIALPIIDALRALGHRTEVQNGGHSSITAITTKRRASRPYQLVLANFKMTDVDPVEFLHTLRQHRETVAVCFYANPNSLPREAFSAVEQLDGRFVSLPLDRTRLENLTTDVARGISRASQAGENAPFFGTGRVVRRSPSGHADHALVPSTSEFRHEPPVAPLALPETYVAPPLPPESQLPPVTTSISRRSVADLASSEAPFPDETAPPVLRGTAQFSNNARYLRTPVPGCVPTDVITDLPTGHDPQGISLTERNRRSISAQQQPSTKPGVNSPSIGTTSRIRRSVTGKIVNPDIQASNTERTRSATCSACNAAFVAELRAQSYTLPCLRCGNLNRIDP